MDLPDGSIVTLDWLDADGDEIDDRFQPGPGMPMQRRAPLPLAPVSAAQPAVQHQSSQPPATSAGGSNSATKASNSTKGSKKTKSPTFSKKKSGKKSKTKSL
jgi:hypothetical protein